MVSEDGRTVYLQGVTKLYLVIKPTRDSFPENLELIMGLSAKNNYYPSFIVYHEGPGDIQIPYILLELDGISPKEAYDEVKTLVKDCKFTEARLTKP